MLGGLYRALGRHVESEEWLGAALQRVEESDKTKRRGSIEAEADWLNDEDDEPA